MHFFEFNLSTFLDLSYRNSLNYGLSSYVKSNPGVTLSSKQEKQLDKLSNVLAKKYNKLSPSKKAEINKKAETLKHSSGGLKQGVILAVIGLLVMSLAYYVPVVGWLVAIVGAVLLIYGVYLILMDIL